MDIPALGKLLDKPLTERILNGIRAILGEEDAYAADELVSLCEEVLSQVAAVGFAQYVQSKAQKDVYNDFLLQLFNSSGNEYNAGPLYRWSANMVRDCPFMQVSPRLRFYWEKEGEAERLCTRVNALGALRNEVMHGFFVLPPERNRAVAHTLAELLVDLLSADFFSMAGDYHFFRDGSFTGSWNITDPAQWSLLTGELPFGKLASGIQLEGTDAFWKHERQHADNAGGHVVSEPLKAFLSEHDKGAFACWQHPADPEAAARAAAIAHWLNSQPDLLSITYRLSPTGLSYTSSFLLHRLRQLLNPVGKQMSKNKKLEDQVKALRKEYKGKVAVFIDRVHTGLFSPQHVTRLKDFFYENKILLIATGHHYSHFDAFFNASETVTYPACIPGLAQREACLHNYLRFKGPFADRLEDREYVELLHRILGHLCSALEVGGPVVARRFADTHGYPMEYVHEVFALLEPWVKKDSMAFEEDTLDELYGFPSVITETTAIYLALGRRDLKLEYQHKSLSL